MKNSKGLEQCKTCEFFKKLTRSEIGVCNLMKKFVSANKLHPRCPFITGSDLAFLAVEEK